MNNLALAAAALIFPCFVIACGVVYVLRARRPPIPFKDVGLFVGLGLIAVVLGEIWSMLADRWLLGRTNFKFYYAFLTASIPEESFRFLVILYGLSRRRHASLVVAMLLGSLVGLTFGAYEHLGYALTKGWWTWLARSLTSVPYHTLSGAVLGYAAVAWIRTRQPSALIWLGVLVIVHGLADWPLIDPSSKDPSAYVETFLNSGWAGNIASLLVVVILASILGRKAMRSESLDSTTQSTLES